MSEIELKLARIQDLLDRHALDALLLQRAANFAWATCGAASGINVADTCGAVSLLLTRSARYIITDNTEAARLQQEQGLLEQGWEFSVSPWFQKSTLVEELTRGMELGVDGLYPGASNLGPELARLRAVLCPEEIVRFRDLCRLCAEAMDTAVLSIRPGLTELQIAGMLAREALSRGVEPIAHLVGTDERASLYRHPLPTDRRLQRYALLVLWGRKWGLVGSVTRAVHFGRLPEELRSQSAAVAHVDAHFIAATRPGRKWCVIFREAMECYRSYGFPDEWQLHQQGGLAGYQPREIVAAPDSEEEVSVGQIYAWNPSVAGIRSEDTFLVGIQENEILTAIPRWPAVKVNLRGHTFERPLILEIT